MAGQSPSELELRETLRGLLDAHPSGALEWVSLLDDVQRRVDNPPNITLFINSVAGAYQRLLVQGATTAAERLGVQLDVQASTRYGDPEAIVERVLQKPPGGLVIPSGVLRYLPGDVLYVASQLERAQLCVPMVSIGEDVPGVPSVLFDDEGQMATVVRHFTGKEHLATHIAFVGAGDRGQAFRRRKGYLRALAEANLTPILLDGDFTVESGEAAARQLLDHYPQLQVICCANDLMALGVLKVLHDRGQERAVLVSGLDDGVYGITGQFSTVDQDTGGQGFRAVEALVAHLEGLPLEVPLQFAGQFVVGTFCSCMDGHRSSMAASSPKSANLEVLAAARHLRNSVREIEQANQLLHSFLHELPLDDRISLPVEANPDGSGIGEVSESPEPLLRCVARMVRSASAEEIQRWQWMLSKCRRMVETKLIPGVWRKKQAVGEEALKLLGAASDLLIHAEQRVWAEEQLRQERVGQVADLLNKAHSSREVWAIVEKQFPHLAQDFWIVETTRGSSGQVLLACHAGTVSGTLSARVNAPGTTPESCRRTVTHPLVTDGDRVLDAVFELQGGGDWLSQQMLAGSLGAALGRVTEEERRRRARQPDQNSPQHEPWSESRRTRLSLVAQFIRQSVGCDVVVIYPRINGEFPVADLGPAVAGRLHCPAAMLTQVTEQDAVAKLIAYGRSVYVPDTYEDQTTSWLRREDRAGFQQREGIRALSGHVLRRGPEQAPIGALFCNYRKPMPNLEAESRFIARLVRHASLALAMELDGSTESEWVDPS